MSAQRAAGGFTLVAVLVALGIVAMALLAGTRAASTLTSNAQRPTDIVLAHPCAENELVKARLSRQMPSVGDSTEICEQAGRQFSVSVIVRPTPNPQFRRMDAQVFDADTPILRISTIIGRN